MTTSIHFSTDVSLTDKVHEEFSPEARMTPLALDLLAESTLSLIPVDELISQADLRARLFCQVPTASMAVIQALFTQIQRHPDEDCFKLTQIAVEHNRLEMASFFINKIGVLTTLQLTEMFKSAIRKDSVELLKIVIDKAEPLTASKKDEILKKICWRTPAPKIARFILDQFPEITSDTIGHCITLCYAQPIDQSEVVRMLLNLNVPILQQYVEHVLVQSAKCGDYRTMRLAFSKLQSPTIHAIMRAHFLAANLRVKNFLVQKSRSFPLAAGASPLELKAAKLLFSTEELKHHPEIYLDQLMMKGWPLELYEKSAPSQRLTGMPDEFLSYLIQSLFEQKKIRCHYLGWPMVSSSASNFEKDLVENLGQLYGMICQYHLSHSRSGVLPPFIHPGVFLIPTLAEDSRMEPSDRLYQIARLISQDEDTATYTIVRFFVDERDPDKADHLAATCLHTGESQEQLHQAAQNEIEEIIQAAKLFMRGFALECGLSLRSIGDFDEARRIISLIQSHS